MFMIKGSEEKPSQPKPRIAEEVKVEHRVAKKKKAEPKPKVKQQKEKKEPIIQAKKAKKIKQTDQENTAKLFFKVAERGFADEQEKARVRDLIKEGVDRNILNEQDVTPLHMAVIHDQPEVVEFFLEQKANPNTRDIRGYTPLDSAVELDHIAILQMLLDVGARPNMGMGMTTPLHRAAARGYEDAVLMLMEAGADPDVRDEKGQTPRDRARRNGHQYIIDLFVE